MRKCKNRYFYQIFVSPGDAPGAITLNVVWMEREFDAYKLSRCMCPSIYNRMWDRARYLRKNPHFIIPPLHSMPLLGGFLLEYRHLLWYGKTRMVSLPMVKKFQRYVCSFSIDSRTWQTDRQTLRDSKDRAYASHRAVKIALFWNINCVIELVNKACYSTVTELKFSVTVQDVSVVSANVSMTATASTATL